MKDKIKLHFDTHHPNYANKKALQINVLPRVAAVHLLSTLTDLNDQQIRELLSLSAGNNAICSKYRKIASNYIATNDKKFLVIIEGFKVYLQ